MVGSHYGKTYGGRFGGYGSALPPTAQSVVKVQVYLEDAAGQTIGPVPDGLHSWNILEIVPGRGHPGHTTTLGPLYGTGVSDGVACEGAHVLPTEIAPLPPRVPPSLSCV